MLKLCILLVIPFWIIENVNAGYCYRYTRCYDYYHHHHHYHGCGFNGYHPCHYHYHYYYCRQSYCCPGWTGYNCNTPICTGGCRNGGTCVAPETCKCPSTTTGKNCENVYCGHLKPCYPGSCYNGDQCDCIKGFQTSANNGCLQFSNDNNPPVISECEILLAHIRRTDKKRLFYYTFPCSNVTGIDIMWSNQELFNYAQFSMETFYDPLEYLPPRPSYVRNASLGIVAGRMDVKHTKHPRNEDDPRFIALSQTYTCNGVSNFQPETNVTTCNRTEENYKINIEHNDIFTVTFVTTSGGYRSLYYEGTNTFYRNQYYYGQTTTKVMEFRFDFIAPIHCSEPNNSVKCSGPYDEPIFVAEEITKDSIRPTWGGWSDSLSGIDRYNLEIFKLEPDIHGELTELEPLRPIFSTEINETHLDYPSYRPSEPGMYSILLQVSDQANNSKVARRLVLYDDSSQITLTKPGFFSGENRKVEDMKIGDGGMYVTSAIPETGYMWQTSEPGSKTHIVLNWENHFVNKIHRDGKFLSKVLPYPTQFAELQDDAILRSQKYVSLDDNEGARQISGILNINGIVKFETNRVLNDDKEVPTTGWSQHLLKEQYETSEILSDGSHVRLWVRATDIMNNTATDYTEVHIDNTIPRVADERIFTNVKNGTYTYTTRMAFKASDDGSGVHRVDYKLYVDGSSKIHGKGSIPANRNNETNACRTDPDCNCVLDICFLKDQLLDIDNCWFMVPKSDLNKSASIVVEVFNQALLYQSLSFNISRLSNLNGLEEYSGPTNIRLEKQLASGVRLVWDLPETASCYGRANILLILVASDGSVRVINVYNEETSIDLVGLDPDQEYQVSLSSQYQGTQLSSTDYSFKTAPKENYLQGGVIAGVIIGVLVIVGLLLAILVVLYRRGHMKPLRRGLEAASVKYRKSMAVFAKRGYQRRLSSDSLYMYGEMDFKDMSKWEFSRNDVILESLLKSGSFADIYLARLRSTNQTVVAKTLKKDFSKDDELLMKAKINFNSMEVGQHPNILNFMGAVVAESEIGPFIIYEFCPNGSLREYLESIRNDRTVETQEKLLRFGLGVTRGMEHLASRKIVHRRLAARNILLDNSIEVKIAGFGPQPTNVKENDGEPGKKERIPIKWMAPECLKSTSGATEKSDVWSFGVVLWEIFSFGEGPYENLRGRDIPAKLKSGYRLPKPEQCDEKWYGIMKRAWAESPSSRPSFSQIRDELDEAFVAAPTEDYYYSK